MSYIGGPFSHDVFVSYSHGDVNGTGQGALQAWSRAFAEELRKELQAMPNFGGALSVFLDESHRTGDGLDPMNALTEQLQKEIADSATVAVLLSPHYLGSTWCAQERDWWVKSQADRNLSPAERIALARIWPLPKETELPPLFVDSVGQPMLGFWFYDRDRADTRPQPYDWPAPDPTSKGPFREALLELVGRLKLKLEGFKAIVSQRELAQKNALKLAQEQPVVYLHARASQAAEWDDANDKLSQRGYIVMPGQPDSVLRDPIANQARREQRVETLTACDALVLLASPDGTALDADIAVVGRIDRSSACAIAKRSIPCAVLDAVGVPIATPPRLRSAKAMQVDWIDATSRPWEDRVKSWLVDKSNTLLAGGA